MNAMCGIAVDLKGAENMDKMFCGMCKKTVIKKRNAEGKLVNTDAIFIDKWGFERNFCKDCMNKKGENQKWKY